MENYRPISLLSTLFKVFERVVFEQINEYLNCNNLLYQSQYGFRKDHSTELASTELIDRICKVMDMRLLSVFFWIYPKPSICLIMMSSLKN